MEGGEEKGRDAPTRPHSTPRIPASAEHVRLEDLAVDGYADAKGCVRVGVR